MCWPDSVAQGTDTLGARRPWTSTCYGYAALSRLASVDAPEGLTGYGYDAGGNRLTMTRGGAETGYDYDAADRLQLVTAPGGPERSKVVGVPGRSGIA